MEQVAQRNPPDAVHRWVRSIQVAFVPGATTPLLDQVLPVLRQALEQHGHGVVAAPDAATDLVITTARVGEPVNWRRAPLLSARARYRLPHTPDAYTLVSLTPAELERWLGRFRAALAKPAADPADYAADGLAPQAYRVLHEQGQRGGPMLALLRLLQAQTKCFRIVLFVGEERPLAAYHFDLVGAHPRTDGSDEETFYRDLVWRMATAASTSGVNQHQFVGPPLARETWLRSPTLAGMRRAAAELGRRRFFTSMIRIADLVSIPALGEAVASQYSEGCFATWDSTIAALVATATGSARPVDKANVTDEELVPIVGIRPQRDGAMVRLVEGKADMPPSSEAVEMVEMDAELPRITLGPAWNVSTPVPVIRSKLHGHRGVKAYDPDLVEYVPMDAAYAHYMVSCGSDAQAQGIRQAFARSEALRDPADKRRLVFTILPGHGVVIAEKWVVGTAPFQAVWEAMDRGALCVSERIPQGPLHYEDGHLCLDYDLGDERASDLIAF